MCIAKSCKEIRHCLIIIRGKALSNHLAIMGKESIDKFKGFGFHTWQTKVKGYLMKKNLWAVISQGEEGSSTRASSSQQQSRDEQALGIIITALDNNFIHYVDGQVSAYLAWQTLEHIFGTQAKHSKISLKMQLYGLY